MRTSRWIVTLSAMVVLCAAAAACGSSSGASDSTGSSGGSKATITLYSGQHEETTQALVNAFEAKTGITVKIRSDDEDTLAQQILAEGSHSPADVFFTENSPPLMALQEKGLLSKLPASTLAAVPSQYSSPAGDWVGVSARVSVIAYNTDKLSAAEVPTSVLDLAKPEWKGKLGIAPSETDFQPIVTSIAHAEGTDAAKSWLEAVKSNGASHTYPDNETLVSEINQGKVELGIINHYYWFRLAKENGSSKMHSAISYLAPHDPGYIVDVSGAGVLASSSHQTEAQELVAFLVSAEGQSILAHSNSFEYPLRIGAPADPALKPFDELQPTALSIAELGDGSTAIGLLQEVQLL
jgi:iron(III) transport system substrate-binding protein